MKSSKLEKYLFKNISKQIKSKKYAAQNIVHGNYVLDYTGTIISWTYTKGITIPITIVKTGSIIKDF